MLPILLVGIGLLSGCGAPPAQEVAIARAEVADPEMCAEHGVLEAVCPKCNPRLEAVFRAHGDWCDEHGFPESFCPICRPEQGGRPAEAVAVDPWPADGTVVRFRTREVARLAGIETAEVVEAGWTEGVEAVARLAWDATRVGLASARSPGVVTELRVDVGARVERGEPLATVRSARVGGERSRLTSARRALEIAEAELVRKRELLAAGVSSPREVEGAEAAVGTARAELAAVRSELGLVGGGEGDSYTVTAPLDGVITRRSASVGQSVVPGDPVFEVVDPSRMWAEIDVPEADLGRVAAGRPVTLRFDALPGRSFEGTLDGVAPSVDPRTRTALARVRLENPDGALRANLYGRARIVTGSGATALIVPAEAVQPAGEVRLVFVRRSDDAWVARRVEVLGRDGDRVRIAGAVAPGDRVATTGSFLLKTETLKDSIGAGCCDVE